MSDIKEYTAYESAKLLGKKVRTIREWIRTGKILATKTPNGREWRISEKEIKRLLEER